MKHILKTIGIFSFLVASSANAWEGINKGILFAPDKSQKPISYNLKEDKTQFLTYVTYTVSGVVSIPTSSTSNEYTNCTFRGKTDNSREDIENYETIRSFKTDCLFTEPHSISVMGEVVNSEKGQFLNLTFSTPNPNHPEKDVIGTVSIMEKENLLRKAF